MTAQTCPHCSAPARDDGRPRCLCQAVGAEDFDPLRVRPYVRLPDGTDTTGAAGTTADALRPEPRPAPRFGFRTVPPAGSRTGVRGGPGTDAGGGPGAGLLPDARTAARDDAARRRKKQAALAVMAVAAASLAAGAVLLSGALLSDTDQYRALPDDHRHMPSAARTPDSRDDGPAGGGPGRRAAPPSAAPTPAPQRPTRARPSPGPSRAASPPPSPSAAARTATASGSITGAPESRAPSSPPAGPLVLREGAGGPEVLELQRRLEQVAAYPGPVDGRYGAAVREAVAAYQWFHGLRQDPTGVYGVQTRRSLEARTVEP
ncbi:peptidoglycan-binding protein [Streptomyces sp. NPDC018045]|uniref:peptidoglycan-binding protein n=1 Tax=Streptomyces sp. NPDC018045 TaxID=3365037 RepID=UPI0037BC237F